MGQNISRPYIVDPSTTGAASTVGLPHFSLLRVIGRGSFGKVRIVERRDTKKLYALKYISKVDCVKMGGLKNVLRERLLLERLDHPLLVNLRFAFQDTDFLYLVVDLMLGGDLRFHISRKHFVESTVRFWIAEIACALRYLHRKGIAHRDIKPENAVLSYDGHVHLTDFNIATKVDPGNLLYTQCGTLEYQAPEMLAGCGYGTSVDWWSLGVMFYECIYGVRPFSRHNPEDVCEAILYGAVRHPTSDNFTVSAECRDAINSLLERDLNKRIGCGRPNRGLRNVNYSIAGDDGSVMGNKSMMSLMSGTIPTAAAVGTFWQLQSNEPNDQNVMHLSDHLYFSGMDWARLQRKEVKPPFVPGATCDNFNPALDIEELLLEKNPLDIRSRTRVTLAKMGCYSEIQLIDDKFKDFDYLQFANHDGINPIQPSQSPHTKSILDHQQQQTMLNDFVQAQKTQQMKMVQAIQEADTKERQIYSQQQSLHSPQQQSLQQLQQQQQQQQQPRKIPQYTTLTATTIASPSHSKSSPSSKSMVKTTLYGSSPPVNHASDTSDTATVTSVSFRTAERPLTLQLNDIVLGNIAPSRRHLQHYMEKGYSSKPHHQSIPQQQQQQQQQQPQSQQSHHHQRQKSSSQLTSTTKRPEVTDIPSRADWDKLISRLIDIASNSKHEPKSNSTHQQQQQKPLQLTNPHLQLLKTTQERLKSLSPKEQVQLQLLLRSSFIPPVSQSIQLQHPLQHQLHSPQQQPDQSPMTSSHRYNDNMQAQSSESDAAPAQHPISRTPSLALSAFGGLSGVSISPSATANEREEINNRQSVMTVSQFAELASMIDVLGEDNGDDGDDGDADSGCAVTPDSVGENDAVAMKRSSLFGLVNSHAVPTDFCVNNDATNYNVNEYYDDCESLPDSTPLLDSETANFRQLSIQAHYASVSPIQTGLVIRRRASARSSMRNIHLNGATPLSPPPLPSALPNAPIPPLGSVHVRHS